MQDPGDGPRGRPRARTARAWLAAGGSAIAGGAAIFLRMSAAYGPFNLSLDPGDWVVLWELVRHGQVAPRILLESVALGTAAAAVPWLVLGLTGRRREGQ